MKIVTTSIVGWFGASAITVFPFVFISPKVEGKDLEDTKKHEGVHYEQQKLWATRGLGIGLLAWFFLYLFVMPYGWNPFRKKWEIEAYTAQGITKEKAIETLQGSPYFLWW